VMNPVFSGLGGMDTLSVVGSKSTHPTKKDRWNGPTWCAQSILSFLRSICL